MDNIANRTTLMHLNVAAGRPTKKYTAQQSLRGILKNRQLALARLIQNVVLTHRCDWPSALTVSLGEIDPDELMNIKNSELRSSSLTVVEGHLDLHNESSEAKGS